MKQDHFGVLWAPRSDAVTPAVLSGYSKSIPLPNGTAKPTPFSCCGWQMLGPSPPGWHGAVSGGPRKGKNGREGGLETSGETHESDDGVQALDAGMPEAHL